MPDRQERLPLETNAQLALVKGAVFDPFDERIVSAFKGEAPSIRKLRALRDLLEKIVLFRASQERYKDDNGIDRELGIPGHLLAHSLNVDVRTIQRRTRVGQLLGFVKVKSLSRRDGSTDANSYSVDFDRLRSFQASNPGPRHDVTQGRHDVRGGRHGVTQGRHGVMPLESIKKPKKAFTKPPPPGADDEHAEWAKVEEVLLRLGVAKAAEAVEAAATYIEPSEAMAILGYFEKNRPAYGPGALYARLLIARPELPADQGWPQPSAAAQNLKANVAREENDRAQRRADELLERYNSQLDGLDKEQLDSLAERALAGTPEHETYRRSGLNHRTTRVLLAWQFHREANYQPVSGGAAP